MIFIYYKLKSVSRVSIKSIMNHTTELKELLYLIKKESCIPPGLFKSLIHQECKDKQTIKNDLIRMNNKHQDLRLLLYVISSFYSFGYTQGLNIICNYLLNIIQQPEITFKIFDSLLYNPTTNLISYMDFSTKGLQHDLDLLQKIIKTRFPKRLNKVMEQLELHTSTFALRWYLCLYLYDINNPDVNHFIISYFVKKGRKGLIHISVAICDKVDLLLKQQDINDMDQKSVIDMLHDSCTSITISEIENCKISKDDLWLLTLHD